MCLAEPTADHLDSDMAEGCMKFSGRLILDTPKHYCPGVMSQGHPKPNLSSMKAVPVSSPSLWCPGQGAILKYETETHSCHPVHGQACNCLSNSPLTFCWLCSLAPRATPMTHYALPVLRNVCHGGARKAVRLYPCPAQPASHGILFLVPETKYQIP